ncbi:MAG: LD-carboxypeptidase [Defluviitaleaceae bacterium]|nr:LD-carboxypeptidase [Defluviitaleaceae bacterium]
MKETKMIIPKLLRDGDVVAIIAPAGPVNAEKLVAGAEILRNAGLRVRIFESCFARHEYLAGPDALRLHDLHTAFADPQIRAIFAARGGYGSARLLPRINFNLIRNNPKIFAGYSDITALHIAFNQFAGLATFHAPMPAADLPNADDATLQPFFENLFLSSRPVFFSDTLPPSPKNFTETAQSAVSCSFFERGELGGKLFLQKKFSPQGLKKVVITGGNLTIITSLLGTPYEIDTRGKVLFLEEVGEAAYRADRMFLQLKLAGKLRDAAGFILGDFSGENIEFAVNEFLVPEGKPLVQNFPAGHCMPNFTLPLGIDIHT